MAPKTLLVNSCFVLEHNTELSINMGNKISLSPSWVVGIQGKTEVFNGHKGKEEPFLQTCFSLAQDASACLLSQLSHQSSRVTTAWPPVFSLTSLQFDITP